MTFEQYMYDTYGPYWDKGMFEGKSIIYAAFHAWNAAKEDSKPFAKIKYVDYVCDGWYKNGNKPFWTVTNTSATVIKQSEEEAIVWAINNGYRVK